MVSVGSRPEVVVTLEAEAGRPPGGRPPAPRSDLGAAIAVSGLIAAGLSLGTSGYVHWFLIPVLVCGVTIGVDAVAYLRGRFDTFDPVGLVGLLGYVAFFLAPLLHVRFDVYLLGTDGFVIQPPPDWRPWLGAMAILNAFGLVVYRVARGATAPSRSAARRTKRMWRIAPHRFPLALGAGIAVSSAANAYVFASFGGFAGYVESFERAEGFEGLGWILLLSEALPILLFMAYLVFLGRTEAPVSAAWIGIGVLLAVQVLLAGLRGNRGDTVLVGAWAVAAVHYWIRPLGVRVVRLGAILMILFAFFMGFYKAAGLDGLMAALTDPSERSELEESTGRDLNALVLGDFARSDVQARLLYGTQDWQLEDFALGRTYLAGLAVVVPKSVWPDRPVGFIEWGTDALYGRGTAELGFTSTRNYGIGGEGILNFGPFGVIAALGALGLAVRGVRRLVYGLEAGDARRLLVGPLPAILAYLLLVPTGIAVFLVVKNMALPFAVVVSGVGIASRTGFE